MAESNRLLPLRILQILQKHSDADHPLFQKDLIALLSQEYGITADRGAVRRCIHELMQNDDIPLEGIEREYEYKDMITKRNETGTQYTGLYYQHDFNPSELHMLMDGVLFSRNIPSRQREDLIQRLSALGNKYFQSYMSYFRGSIPDMPEIPQLFWHMELLDEAIRTKKQIRMEYGYLNTEFMLTPNWPRKKGEPYWMIINPYRLAALDGRYFLICNTDKYDDLSVFRVDRMIRCELLDTPAKPARKVKGLEGSPNTSKFVQSNAFMGYGESGTVTFSLPKDKAYEAIDMFGKTISFKPDPDNPEMLRCSVFANHYSVKMWALQNIGIIKILSPVSLVKEIREALAEGLEKYRT